MPTVLFNCPATGREVPSGIETDDYSFESMAQELTLLCPHCGELHTWQMREGHIWQPVPDSL